VDVAELVGSNNNVYEQNTNKTKNLIDILTKNALKRGNSKANNKVIKIKK
jgi:hypothetical protein